MTELCRYPITNTELKIDLIIEVFCANLTYVRDWRTHEEIKDRGYYIVFSWGNGNSLLEESNIRGH
jgi:hypothetical protein